MSQQTKSLKDEFIPAQSQRGTSAALGTPRPAISRWERAGVRALPTRAGFTCDQKFPNEQCIIRMAKLLESAPVFSFDSCSAALSSLEADLWEHAPRNPGLRTPDLAL